MGKGATVALVSGVFVVLFVMLYFASNMKIEDNLSNTNATNTTLQNAIRIAEGLDETKEFKHELAAYEIQTQVVYLHANQTEFYRQDSDQSFLPKDKPTILVAYAVKLGVENSAILRVFIDPETNVVYGTYVHSTQFG